jgi:hypothetical protein
MIALHWIGDPGVGSDLHLLSSGVVTGLFGGDDTTIGLSKGKLDQCRHMQRSMKAVSSIASAAVETSSVLSAPPVPAMVSSMSGVVDLSSSS